jgi:hypothetical protein
MDQGQLFSELFKRRDESTVEFLESLGCKCPFDRESFLACLDGDEGRILQKIENGTFVADNCLTVACAKGNERIVAAVLERVVEKERSTQITDWHLMKQCRDALETTCKLGHQKIIELFVPIVSFFDVQSLLAVVFANGHVECALYLMTEYSFRDRMYDAFESGKCESVQAVIECDSKWYTDCQEYKVSLDRRTGFVINTNHKNTEAFMLLTNNLFSNDVYDDHFDNSGLFIDIKGCLRAVCKMENGADFIALLLNLAERQQIDVDFNACFLESCRNGHLPCVKAFLAQGKVTNFGEGLFAAKSCAHLEVVEFLSQTCHTLRNRESWKICF